MVRQERKDRAAGLYWRKRVEVAPSLHVLSQSVLRDYVRQRRLPIVENFFTQMRVIFAEEHTDEEDSRLTDDAIKQLADTYNIPFRTEADDMSDAPPASPAAPDAISRITAPPVPDQPAAGATLRSLLTTDTDEDALYRTNELQSRGCANNCLYQTLDIAGVTVKRWLVNIVSCYNCACSIDLVKLCFNVRGATLEPDIFPGLRWRAPGSSLGISLFSNGWITIAGGQAFAENAKAVALCLRMLEELGMQPSRRAGHEVEAVTFGFEFSFGIRLSKFKNAHLQMSQYEPERFSGLFFYMTEPIKCTWIVFANGRAIVAGLRTIEGSYRAAEGFIPLAIQHKF